MGRHQSSFFGVGGGSPGHSDARTPLKRQSSIAPVAHHACGWRDDLYECKVFESDSPLDALFLAYLRDKHVNMKSEIFVSQTVADRLDETEGAVLIFPGPVPPVVALPEVRAGHTRAESELVALLEPLGRHGDGSETKFRATQVLSFELTSTIRSILKITPTFVIRKIIEQKVENSFKNLTNYCSMSRELAQIIKDGNRRQLYQHLRAHLMDRASAHS